MNKTRQVTNRKKKEHFAIWLPKKTSGLLQYAYKTFGSLVFLHSFSLLHQGLPKRGRARNRYSWFWRILVLKSKMKQDVGMSFESDPQFLFEACLSFLVLIVQEIVPDLHCR
jgi:hypothetical protein